MKAFALERKTFPSPTESGPEGILQISDDISVERLLEAYSFGIFPWPVDDYPILWFSPPERGVLDFASFHVPQSQRKWLAQNPVRFTWNEVFREVIESCQRAKRPGQSGTWITPELMDAYIAFHKAGYSHSVECWDEDDNLIGGLYGVFVAGVFCAESMFYRRSNASKACLVHLVETLSAQGFEWIDVQMITSTVASFGGHLISRDEFLLRLETGKRQPRRLKIT